MNKVLIAGSINMDVVATAGRHPLPGETVSGKELHFIPGGKGANQAVAAAKLGATTYMIGKLGSDAFADTLEKFLRSQGLKMDYVQRTPDAATGTALIVVADSGENSIVVVPGANETLRKVDIEQVVIQSGDILVSQFEVPLDTIDRFFTRGKVAGARTLLNPAPAKESVGSLLEQADILVLNETELAFFLRIKEVDDAALKTSTRQLQGTADQIIIVTLGARGIFVLEGTDDYMIAGRKVEAVDTTGAGDCFVGALASQLSKNMAVKEAVAYANIAASISVQRLGAGTSMPTDEEVGQVMHS
jgi:ribokinase